MPITTTSSAIDQDSPPEESAMNTSSESAGHVVGHHAGEHANRYFSNESLEERNSTASSNEGLSVERRKVRIVFF